MRCIECKEENCVRLISEKEIIDVEGEPIEVDVTYRQCDICGADWENIADGDPLDDAYRIYRTKHNMMQPEEIKNLRKNFDLTQQELSCLLGWGDVTISRYENGALQSKAYDIMLQTLRVPENLKTLLERTPEAISKDKYERIMNKLEQIDSLCNILEDNWKYIRDKLSGWTKLHYKKIQNAILYFCRRGMLRTKLNKLLFYLDFKHCKENSMGITGLRYYHEKYGPVPHNYNELIRLFILSGYIKLKIEDYGVYKNGWPLQGERYTSTIEPDLNVFSEEELKTLKEVDKKFKKYGSTEIKDFSHKEKAYIATDMYEDISYEYAKDLNI